MTVASQAIYSPASGYMTEKIRGQYIEHAIANELLPPDAHRMRDIVSLTASADSNKPIQFWQLYSVLGPDRIINAVTQFYQHVFDDEQWFKSVFMRVGGLRHHVSTQSAMWIDVMGGGLAYHGAEFRLSFHHTHNAIELMNERGAERWAGLMLATLEDPLVDLTDDPRVRLSVNTFLSYFFGKYADEFKFTHSSSQDRGVFGETNAAVKRRVNFMKMTSDAIEALPENDLKDALTQRGVDVSQYKNKSQLVNKALSL